MGHIHVDRFKALALLSLLIGASVLVVVVPVELGGYLGSDAGRGDDAFSNATIAVGDGLRDLLAQESLNETELERRIHAEVNEVRRKRGLSELDWDPKLAGIARNHSQDMANRSYISHTSPVGETIRERYFRSNYRCKILIDGESYFSGTENIAVNWWHARTENGNWYATEEDLAEGIVDQLMRSKPHRENLLKPGWLWEGIGVATAEVDGETKVYVTQNFC